MESRAKTMFSKEIYRKEVHNHDEEVERGLARLKPMANDRKSVDSEEVGEYHD